MGWELDPDSFKRAVETSWEALNPTIRGDISGFVIERDESLRDPRSASIVTVRERGDSAIIVVRYDVLKGRLEADTGISWRPELTRAIRQAVLARARLTTRSSHDEGPDGVETEPDTLAEQASRAEGSVETPTESEAPATDEADETGVVTPVRHPVSMDRIPPPCEEPGAGVRSGDVTTLWFGLDETFRKSFASMRIDEGDGPDDGNGEALVSIDHGSSRSTGILVVYLGSLKKMLAESPRLPWRPILAKAIKRTAIDHLLEEKDKTRPARPAGDAAEPPTAPRPSGEPEERTCEGGTGQDGRISFADYSSILDRWSTPPRSDRPAPPVADAGASERTSAPPSWATSTRSGRETSPPEPPPSAPRRSMGVWIASPFQWIGDLFLTPGRAAFRHRPVESARAKALLWAWRVGTVACYAASVLGVVHLIWTLCSVPSQVPDQALEGTDDVSDRAPIEWTADQDRTPLESVALRGERWLIPPGWRVEEPEDSGSVVFQGPEEARIEIVALEPAQATGERSMAAACAGGRSAQVALGGNGLDYVEARYDAHGEVWHSRCVFQGDVMIRAEAPLAVFLGANLEDWLLLIVLDHQMVDGGEVSTR